MSEEIDDGITYFTKDEWELVTSCGAYNEYDGSAYWVLQGKKTELDAFYTDPPASDCTVVFYGK